MPRRHRERASVKERRRRLEIERKRHPFGGDVEALRAEVVGQTLRHAYVLGYDEILRRIWARGIQWVPQRREVWEESLVKSIADHDEVRRRFAERGVTITSAIPPGRARAE